MAFLPCHSPTTQGHRVSELLGNCWKVPKNRSRSSFSKPPMGMAPGDEEAGSREPGVLSGSGDGTMEAGNGPPARFALSSPVFKSE